MTPTTRPKPIVAIVDDDPRVLESIEDLLESSGYVAHGFSSAVTLLARGLAGWDALITDIGLPGMDGFELRDLVLAERPGLPIFLITGRHELTDQNRAKGAAGFFRKPFDPRVLLDALDDALHDRMKEDRNET